MSGIMRIDSEEEKPIPEDNITIEEISSPAKTVVILDLEASADPLQLHQSAHSLTVALRKKSPKKKGVGLFKNPHRWCLNRSTPSRPHSVVHLNIED